MAQDFELTVNGKAHVLTAEPDTPLLYLLINDLELKGPKFGCGLAQCGACSVLIDGRETRACVYPVAAARGRAITTVEGLPAWHAARGGRNDPASGLHPVQAAMIAEQAPQCGYCTNGMVIKAAELLSANPDPDDEAIIAAMDGHLCRCGTYPRIMRAIRRAAGVMRE